MQRWLKRVAVKSITVDSQTAKGTAPSTTRKPPWHFTTTIIRLRWRRPFHLRTSGFPVCEVPIIRAFSIPLARLQEALSLPDTTLINRPIEPTLRIRLTNEMHQGRREGTLQPTLTYSASTSPNRSSSPGRRGINPQKAHSDKHWWSHSKATREISKRLSHARPGGNPIRLSLHFLLKMVLICHQGDKLVYRQRTQSNQYKLRLTNS